ncbi:MAG: hypothetical protein GY853_08850 [PVC group bacterium]|nr:hypothetical protein [PVC group bacterium]
MIKKFILFFLLSIIVLIVGGYFYINLILLPRQVIPQITTQVQEQLQRKISINSIYLAPTGKISIRGITFYNPDETPLLRCKNIKISPSYRGTYNAWKKNKDLLHIPLNIKLKDINLRQDPLAISGNADSYISITLDLKNSKNIDWKGNITLQDFIVANIPFFGDIEDLHGTIKVTPSGASTEGIEGTINHAPADLKFTLTDFSAPHLELNTTLTPLSLALKCSLVENMLTLDKVDAAYNNINLDLSGSIKDVSTNPTSNIFADITIDLEDLSKLPLEIKTLMLKLNPKGIISSKINIEGPLKNLAAIQVDVELESPEVSCLNYSIKNIEINAALKKGILNLENCYASIFDNDTIINAECNIIDPAMPFTTDIKLKKWLIKKILINLDLEQEISGNFDADILVKGNINDLNNIEISYKTILNNIKYENSLFPPEIQSNGRLAFQNLKDITIKDITIEDTISELDIKGMISDLLSPYFNLSIKLQCDISKLADYKMISLPVGLTLSGLLRSNFSLKGPATSINTIGIPFEITSDTITINQSSLNTFELKGFFEAMKLTISSLDTKIYDGECNIVGTVDITDLKTPVFQTTTQIKDINLETLLKSNNITNVQLKGLLSSNLEISGEGSTPETLQAKISLATQLNKVNVQDIALKGAQLFTDLNYTKTDINITRLDLIYNSITINSKATITSLLNKPQIELTLNSNLELEDLDKLPITLPENVQDLNLSGIINTVVTANGPFSAKEWTQIQMITSITSDQITIKGIIIEDLDISTNLKNKILDIKAETNTYTGNLAAEANVDLLVFPQNFRYQGNLKIDTVDIGQLIEESKIVQQKHKGIFSAKANFSGQGVSHNTVKADARFDLTDAKLDGLQILHSIGNISGTTFLSDFEVSQGSGTFKIENNEVRTQDTMLIGTDATITAKGAIDFFQNFKDFEVMLVLSDSGVDKTNPNLLKEFFIFENDKYCRTIPIKGSLTNPKPDLDKIIKEEAGRQAKKIINKQLDGLLEGLFK